VPQNRTQVASSAAYCTTHTAAVAHTLTLFPFVQALAQPAPPAPTAQPKPARGGKGPRGGKGADQQADQGKDGQPQQQASGGGAAATAEEARQRDLLSALARLMKADGGLMAKFTAWRGTVARGVLDASAALGLKGGAVIKGGGQEGGLFDLDLKRLEAMASEAGAGEAAGATALARLVADAAGAGVDGSLGSGGGGGAAAGVYSGPRDPVTVPEAAAFIAAAGALMTAIERAEWLRMNARAAVDAAEVQLGLSFVLCSPRCRSLSFYYRQVCPAHHCTPLIQNDAPLHLPGSGSRRSGPDLRRHPALPPARVGRGPRRRGRRAGPGG
jgi:hypothetical protein